MNNGQKPRLKLHPITVVSKRTGLTKDVIRIWERRYHAVNPERDESGRRLYTEADLYKLMLLKQAVDGGRRISDVVNLTDEQIRNLVKADDLSHQIYNAIPVENNLESAQDFLSGSLNAVMVMDSSGLIEILSKAEIQLGRFRLRSEVIVPLINKIGDNWSNGSLRISAEHLASAVIKAFISEQWSKRQFPPNAPIIVITTPSGQIHELGAQLAAEVAVENGWQPIYLGPNLPAEEIAAVALKRQAKAIALSIVYPNDDPYLDHELTKLRSAVGRNIAIITGGAAVGNYQATLKKIKATIFEDFHKFVNFLKSIPA